MLCQLVASENVCNIKGTMLHHAMLIFALSFFLISAESREAHKVFPRKFQFQQREKNFKIYLKTFRCINESFLFFQCKNLNKRIFA